MTSDENSSTQPLPAADYYLALKFQAIGRLAALRMFCKKTFEYMIHDLEVMRISYGQGENRSSEDADQRMGMLRLYGIWPRDMLLGAVVQTQFIVENTLKGFLRERLHPSLEDKVRRFNLGKIQQCLEDEVGILRNSSKWTEYETVHLIANCIKHNDARVDARLASRDGSLVQRDGIRVSSELADDCIKIAAKLLEWIFAEIVQKAQSERWP